MSTPSKIIQNIDEFILKYITIINGESIRGGTFKVNYFRLGKSKNQ